MTDFIDKAQRLARRRGTTLTDAMTSLARTDPDLHLQHLRSEARKDRLQRTDKMTIQQLARRTGQTESTVRRQLAADDFMGLAQAYKDEERCSLTEAMRAISGSFPELHRRWRNKQPARYAAAFDPKNR